MLYEWTDFGTLDLSFVYEYTSKSLSSWVNEMVASLNRVVENFPQEKVHNF